MLAALGEDPRGPTTEVMTWQERHGYNRFDDREVVVAPRLANETDAARIADVARRRVPAESAVVLLIDNLHPEPGHQVFGRFRDALWAAPVVWIAAGDGDRQGYLDPPADVFWEAVEWLDPLTGDDVSELLHRRIEAAGPNDADAEIVKANLALLVELLEDATPRDVIRAAAQVADRGSIDAAFGASERFEQARAAGGDSAAMLLAEIERIGRPVQAGDQELLGRMGLTRPRIVQLLNRLERNGLVQRHQEGRRVVFEVKP